MTMKKRIYISPEIETVETQTWEMIARSLPITDEETENDATMSNKHHNGGAWGNIWER